MRHRTRVTRSPDPLHRQLTITDVRLDTDGFTLRAAPLWAYRKVKNDWGYSVLQPHLPAWRPLLRQLQRRADQAHATDVATAQRRREGLEAGTLTEKEQTYITWAASLGIDELTPRPRKQVTALKGWYGPHWCRGCRRQLISGKQQPCHYCSNRCADNARSRYERRSRAKPAESRTRKCIVCRARFTPKRSDARCCSVKCRVTAHRRAHAAA